VKFFELQQHNWIKTEREDIAPQAKLLKVETECFRVGDGQTYFNFLLLQNSLLLLLRTVVFRFFWATVIVVRFKVNALRVALFEVDEHFSVLFGVFRFELRWHKGGSRWFSHAHNFLGVVHTQFRLKCARSRSHLDITGERVIWWHDAQKLCPNYIKV